MRKTKKIGLIIKLLIIALIVTLVIIAWRQLTKTTNVSYSKQESLATDYNIKGDLCLEIENGPVANPYKGDLNKDGYITRADSTYLLSYSAKKETGITVDNTLTDLNNDGEVTALDSRIVLRIATYINDYRNYMLNEPEGIDLQDMISYVGEDYLKNCNILFVGESITIVPNFELSDKASITNKTITTQSSDETVATVEKIDNDTKIKVTAKGVGDVQIIVTSDEDPQTIGVLNLRVYGNLNIVGQEKVNNYKTGDINTDGIITNYDAMELLNYVAGINNNLAETEVELDINKDGKVTAADAREILRLSGYLNNELTLEESDIKIWGNNSREIYNTLHVGEIFTLEAIDCDGTELNNVNWSSSDTNILTVENGIVTAVAEGTAKITVSNSSNTISSSITFKVKAGKKDSTTQLEYIDNGDGTCKIVGYSGTNTVLVIPENINELKVIEIGDNAFKDCISLTRIEIPSSVSKVGENAFSGCINLHVLYVPSVYNSGTEETLQGATIAVTKLIEEVGYENIYDYCFDMITYIDYGEYCSIDGAFTGSAICAIPSSICGKPVTTIEDNSFQSSNAEGTVVKIPETVTTIGNEAFSSKVTRIVWLTEEGPQNLNVATDAFDSNAKVICLTNKGLYNLLNTDSYDVNTVGVVHTDNDQLVVGDENSSIFGYVEPGWEDEKIYDYSGANGDRKRIYPLAFANNTAIAKIDITGWSNFTTVGNGAFMNCTNLSEVYLPKNTTTIGIKAFSNCTGLNKLILPEKISSIGQFAFDGMQGTVYYPSSIKTIIEAYEGTFNNFVEIKLDSVILKNSPTKTEYYIGDTLDTTGLTLVEIYNSGETKEITTGFECTPTKLETAGIQTITITYGEKNITFEVTVKEQIVEEVTVESIVIKTAPTVVDYFAGDTLNTQGLVITVTYSDGTTEDITSGFECSKTKLEEVGEQEITVTYKEKTATFKVTVEEIKVESIAIKTGPTVENYYVGDDLDTTGLVITVTYNNGTTKEITSGFECTPTKLNKAGEEEITVTFEEKTTKFKVKVIEKNQSESVLKATSEYKIEQGNALYITEIMPKTYIQDFRKQIETVYETEIYVKENKITDEKEYVKTNMKMIAYRNGEKVGEYILVVKGDCTGDGKADFDDMKIINNYRLFGTITNFGEVYQKAADVNGDGKKDFNDMKIINNYRLFGTKF